MNQLPSIKIIIKVLVEIKDNKATHLLEVLKGLSHIKVKTIPDEKALFIEEIKEAVENIALVRKGKLKARPAKDMLNELYYTYHIAF